MTIDELKDRQQELLTQKEIELERQARGEDNELELFVINEELLDVTAQIRSLSPASWKWGRGRLTTNLSYGDKDRTSADQDMYLAWRTENYSSNDAIDEERARMLQVAKTSLNLITPRQREFLTLQAKGMNGVQIADKLGLDRSGVATTVRRVVSLRS